MQIKPRECLLEIWRSLVRHSFRDGVWDWGEWGRRSSVADAERLLSLLYPATEIPAFRLDDPDTTQRDVMDALKRVGDASDMPGTVVGILAEFMENHRGGDLDPTFAAWLLLRPGGPESGTLQGTA